MVGVEGGLQCTIAQKQKDQQRSAKIGREEGLDVQSPLNKDQKSEQERGWEMEGCRDPTAKGVGRTLVGRFVNTRRPRGRDR